MLWWNISLFPGLSSIIPASSSTSHPPPEEAFQHQEESWGSSVQPMVCSRAAGQPSSLLLCSGTAAPAAVSLQCPGVPAMPSRGMQSLMGSFLRRFQMWLPHGPHIQPLLSSCFNILVSSSIHKVPHGKFIYLTQYWHTFVFPLISEKSAYYSKLLWSKFQSMNLPLQTLHQYFPDFLAHSVTIHVYMNSFFMEDRCHLT